MRFCSVLLVCLALLICSLLVFAEKDSIEMKHSTVQDTPINVTTGGGERNRTDDQIKRARIPQRGNTLPTRNSSIPIDPTADAFLMKLKNDMLSGNTKALYKKTQFNDKKRLLFVAGLEGSGHHALHAMFDICFDEKLCVAEGDITHSILHLNKTDFLVHGLFAAEDGESSTEHLKVVYTAFKNLAISKVDKLHIIGLSFTQASAMQSYPNYNGERKSLDHPDLSLMAYIAEAVGVDFRVIVLQRPAADILASTKSREMGGKYEERILIDNAAVLFAQLSLVDPQFFRCLQYKEIGGMKDTDKSKLVDFVHPGSLKAPVIDKMLEKIQYSKPKTQNDTEKTIFSNVNYHAFQLEKRLSLIDKLCLAANK